MKFLTPVLLAAFLLVGCEKIEGQLNITKAFKLKNSKGDTHLLSVGTYSADVDGTSKKMTLRLNNDSDEKFVFNHNGNIPENGSFSISSKVSGQPVDLSGTVNTVVRNSEVRQRNEACTYQRAVQVCYPNPRGGTNCTIQYQTYYGTKWVNYYDRQTDKAVSLNVAAVGEAAASADFHGDISFVQSVIVSDSGCR